MVTCKFNADGLLFYFSSKIGQEMKYNAMNYHLPDENDIEKCGLTLRSFPLDRGESFTNEVTNMGKHRTQYRWVSASLQCRARSDGRYI